MVPFIKKYNKFLFLAIAGIFIFTQFFALMQFSDAASNIVVNPGNPQGWTNGDVRPGGEVNYVDDSSSPYPDGALQLKTNATNEAKAQYVRAQTGNLDDISEISYWTKQNSASFTGGSASFQLIVDLDGGDLTTGYATLVFEPYWQNGGSPDDAPVTPGIWQEWDVDSGLFWSSKNFSSGNCILTNGAGGPPFYTLDTLFTTCSDATLLAIGVNVGTYNQSYDINVDGVNFNGDIYDFEQNPVSSKVWICHAPRTDKFVVIEIDKNGAENGHGKGNGTHSDDIIPPFEGFAGLNWTVDNQAYWEENCNKEGQVQGDCDSISRTDENNCEDGCYINDEFVIGDECNEPIELCEVTLFSDTTNTVNEKANANALALDYIHPAWTASIPGATWVWGDNPVVDPTNQTIQTFKNTFYWNGPVTGAVLDIAADNDFVVYVNGVEVASDYSGATFGNQKNYNLAAYITSDALNTFEFKVTNWAWPTVDYQTNPAGLLYRAVVSGPNQDCGKYPEETPVPAVTLSAQKILCDDESLLPNMHNGADIGPNTASNWVAQYQGCELVNGWSYEYKTTGDQSNPGGTTYGPKGGDWNTFTAAVDSTTATKVVPLANTSLIQMREVLPENYIPFSDDTNNNVSAEFFCGSDVAGYDNWEWLQNLKDGDTYYCVAWNVPVERTFGVNANKVICDSEGELPNWGGGGPNITSTTAQDWVAQSEGHCWLADWNFQWSPDNVGNPEDNMGEVAGDWTTFSNGTTSLPVDAVGDGSKVWFREVMDTNYVPFSGTPGNNPYSAEFYCNTDVLNYDNWDWIQNPQADETYYCVGFNVLKPAVLNTAKIVCDDEDYLPNWGNGSTGYPAINSTSADDWLAEGDNSEHCQKVDWQFQWVSDSASSSNPGDQTNNAPLPWDTFTESVNIDTATLGADHKIWAREVTNDNYIPFTGQNTTEDVSAEIYCHTDVLNYDNWEQIDNFQAGQNYYCVAWNVLKTGQIRGLVYSDEDESQTKSPEEPVIEGQTVWLLTHNSPWYLHSVTTTDENGEYLFEDLALPGTYYVCQDVQNGWFQTQLNLAGLNGVDVSALLVGNQIGSDPDPSLDALIAQFCYSVTLSYDQPNAVNKDFGNYIENPDGGEIDEEGEVKGDFDERDVPSSTDDTNGDQGGVVLGDSDTLASTGQPAYLQIFVGLFVSALAVTLLVLSKKSTFKSSK